MTDDPKKRHRPRLEGLDANLDTLLGSLGHVLNVAVSRLDQARDGASQTTQSVDTPFGPIKTTAGIRVRMGGVAAEKVATAQPINPNRAQAAPPPLAARDLVYDLFEDNDAWILTADMPGVTKDQITLTHEGSTIILQTTGARAFHARIALPHLCSAARIERSVINGILTLTFTKEASE